MAQIIKHRRGSLEALSAVTASLVKGELVIASGSSNLNVTNGSSLVFAVPADGQVQAINRFLMGNSAPNTFSAGTYNGMMKGVPYYASGSSTLYLLGSGGNDIIDLTGNISTFSSSVATSINSLSSSIGGGSIGTAVTALNAFSASQLIKDSTLQTYTASVDTKFTTLQTVTASMQSQIARLQESTASLNAFSSSENTKSETLRLYTASIDTKFSTLATYTSSNDTTNTTQNTRLSRLEESTASLNAFSSSENTKSETLRLYTASVDTKFSTLATYTASVNGHISDINTYTSSLKTAFTASGANVTFSGNVTIPGNLTVAGTTTQVNSTTIQLGDNIIELNGTGAANGGLLVKDPTSPNTVSGSLLWDSTNDYWIAGPVGAESKLLRAAGDNVVSGSSQINYTQLSGISANIISASTDSNNIDFIISGGSITANLKGDVVSGSSQIDINNTTNFTSYSSSVSSSLSALSASVGSGNVGVAISNLNAFTASQLVKDSTLQTYTSSVDSRLNQLSTASGSAITRLTALEAETANLETFSSSALTRLSALESETANLEAFSGSENTKSETLRLYTASVDVKFSTLQTLTASTAAQIARLQESTASLNVFSASENTKSETLRLYTASIDTKFSTLATYTGSNDTTNTAQNNRLTSIELFTGSFGTTFSSSVDSRLDTLEGTGTIQGVGTGNNVTFASLTTTNNVTIGGDLVVQGNTVTLNTATLVVEDKTIQLASGSTNAAQANGAGIEVMGASATFTYASTPNAWTANIPISASAFTGSFNLPTGGSSKRIAFRNTTGNLDVVTAPTTDGDVLQWNGTDFVMSNTIDGGSF
jgi:hypothetical protein